jgi:putative transposase
MARKSRTVIPGIPLHMIQRGNNRQACFFADQDYQFYLDCLAKAATRYRCAVHAYVLMTNHVHLLLTPSSDEGPSRLMQAVGRRYVQYVNYTYRRSGTLWEGRFKASVVQAEDYLLGCYRYIELNPVRAGMVNQPEQYRWSSYRAHMGQASDQFLTDHALFEALGASIEARQKIYRALFDAHLDPVEEKVIRQSGRNNWPTGSDRFREQIETMLERRLMPGQRGRPRKLEMDIADYRVNGL